MLDDPKNMWQNQPREASVMTMKMVHWKARELRAKTRKQLLGTLAGPLAAGCFYAFGVREFRALQPILHPLFACALVWSVAGLYFVNRGMWSVAMPGDAGLSTGLEFCRQELARRRALLRRVLRWSFGPVLLALGTFILGLALSGTRDRGILPNGLPFLALVGGWVVGYFLMRMREQRELARELDELNEIQKEAA